MTELKLPSIDYAALAPILIMLGVALLGVLVEAFVPRRRRHVVQLSLALLAVLAALVMTVLNADDRLLTAGGRSRWTAPRSSSRAPSWCSPRWRCC